ncbi:MAG: c-type cytochrome [Acidobacteriota bacterium]|nr:c-type cytochrome [Acidobacteriota bacterium]
MRQSLKIALLTAAGVVAAMRGLLSHEQSPAHASASQERHERSGGAGRKRWLWTLAKHFALFLVVMAIGGFLVAASGVIPIKASSGHWAITRWFLQFSKGRSVATHTWGLEAPTSLDEPRLVLKGAGAYETNCRACHGNPSLRNPRVAQAMTPQPPYLPQTIPQWESGELFYIVKHGIKFTGMPAWLAQQRDDEVWAMVAFLRKFPELDAEGYRRLVSGEANLNREVAPIQGLLGPETMPRAITVSCARCHGMDGLGRGVGAFPKLAGQSPAYLYASLQAYARKERHSGVMEPNAVGLSDEEMRELARYYSSLPKPTPSTPSPETSLAIERGAAIAQRGIPTQRVPSCVACHGPGDIPRNPVYPELAGQYSDYLALQLELFKQQQRGGTAYAHLMRLVATHLTPEQMRDVALYYESLTSARERPAQ